MWRRYKSSFTATRRSHVSLPHLMSSNSWFAQLTFYVLSQPLRTILQAYSQCPKLLSYKCRLMKVSHSVTTTEHTCRTACMGEDKTSQRIDRRNERHSNIHLTQQHICSHQNFTCTLVPCASAFFRSRTCSNSPTFICRGQTMKGVKTSEDIEDEEGRLKGQ